MRQLLREFFDDPVIVCTMCASGEEALVRFQQHRYHLVLLDIAMPGMDGYMTCSAMREIDKHRMYKTHRGADGRRRHRFRAAVTDCVRAAHHKTRLTLRTPQDHPEFQTLTDFGFEGKGTHIIRRSRCRVG